MIKNDILKFFISQNKINPNQHGFIPGKSTCSQLLEAQNDWCLGLDAGNVYDVITIDFRKAFDVVPHDVLGQKLVGLGVCEQTVRWLAAFLIGRKQCVCLNTTYSIESDVSSGVIQGSVIGPFLFALYINDLPDHCKNCTIKLFADDVKAYKCIRSPADRLALQLSLNGISAWAKKNKMDIAIEKCCYFQIGYKNLVLIYTLDSEVIVPCDSILDLGINLHSSLKPGLHCTKIVSKASARSRLIAKTFLSRDPFIMSRAFKVYVRPLLEYCSPVWSPHYKKDIDLVENVQRTFTRSVYRRCHLQIRSYDERLAFLGLQRLELRRIHNDLIFMFKLTHNIISSTLTQHLHFNNNSTRGHRYKLFINHCKKSVLSTFFINRIAPLWNSLNQNCFSINTLSHFKRCINKHDFTNVLKGRI